MALKRCDIWCWEIYSFSFEYSSCTMKTTSVFESISISIVFLKLHLTTWRYHINPSISLPNSACFHYAQRECASDTHECLIKRIMVVYWELGDEKWTSFFLLIRKFKWFKMGFCTCVSVEIEFLFRKYEQW